jgi:hypothetical protein
MLNPMPKAAQKTLNPKTAFREGKNVTPTAPEPPHCRVRIGSAKRGSSHPDQATDRQHNWERKGRRIGSGSGQESGEESAAKRTGIRARIGGFIPPRNRERKRPTKPAAKGKTFRP